MFLHWLRIWKIKLPVQMWEQPSLKNVSPKRLYVIIYFHWKWLHTYTPFQKLFNQKWILFDIWYSLSINKYSFPLIFIFCEQSQFPFEFCKVLILLHLSSYWFIGLFAVKLIFFLKEPRKQKLEKPTGMRTYSFIVIHSLKLNLSMSFNSCSQNSV